MKQQLKFKELMMHASDGILINDPNRKYIEANLTICKMLGYTREEILMLSIQDVIHPKEQEVERQQMEKIKKGKTIIAERKIKRKNGTVFKAILNAKMMSDGNFQTFVHDISLRKKIQNQLKETDMNYEILMEQAPDGIFISGKGQFIGNANKSGCKMVGYSLGELQKMEFIDLIDPENLKALPLQTQEVKKGQVIIVERTLIKKDKEKIIVEIYSKILTDGRFQSIIREITERKKKETELREINQKLKNLTNHIQDAREEERTHIARDIHDELGQQLTGLKMDAAWLLSKSTKNNKLYHDKFNDMIDLIDGMVKSVRRISTELRPAILDDFGLVAALQWKCVEFEKRSGISCHFRSKIEEINFETNVVNVIYRIWQESLTNIIRHAAATEVNALIEKSNDGIIFTVKDNGKSFDKKEAEKKKTLGLLGMKERALMCGAELKIESRKGKGTAVILKVSMPKEVNKQISS